jgi:hypothetical protein
MAAPLRVEERLRRLEDRMTALEQLPDRIDRLESRIDRLESDLRGEIRTGDEKTRRVLREEIRTGNVMIVTSLTEQIEESRRHTRLLFEEALSRISTIQDLLASKDRKKKS